MADTGHQTLNIQQAIELAVRHHNAGRLPEAEGIYQQILQTDPDQPVALHLLGVIAHQGGDNDRAVDLITKAIKYRPDLAEAHSNLGAVFLALGRSDEAVTSYQKALSINPDFAEAHNNLGNALLNLRRLETAVDHYRKAITIKPDYAEAHHNLRGTLQELGRFSEAEQSYRRALEIKFAQCRAYISHDDPDRATMELNDLCLNNPTLNTEHLVKVFVDSWCEAIGHMIDRKNFDVAGQRIRWLYMQTTYREPLFALIQRYLDGAQEERSPDILSKYEMAVQCAMEARYHFQNGDYRKAEECASQCICNAKPFLEDETKRSDAWLLVQLSLKNIKDTEKARLALERLLPDTGQ